MNAKQKKAIVDVTMKPFEKMTKKELLHVLRRIVRKSVEHSLGEEAKVKSK